MLTATAAERVGSDLWRRWITGGYPLVAAVDSEESLTSADRRPRDRRPIIDIGATESWRILLIVEAGQPRREAFARVFRILDIRRQRCVHGPASHALG